VRPSRRLLHRPTMSAGGASSDTTSADRQVTWMKGKSPLVGIRNLLLPRPDDPDRLDASAIPARVLFGPAPKPAADQSGDDFVGFLKQTYLFEDLSHGELTRLARIVHERTYSDGEYISEQGKPGAALFVLRNGVVEITRRKRNGEEFPLATLDPPASFEELAAMGEIVRWSSARARGPVSLVALGRSDLDALGGTFPHLANKILKKLVQITAARVQMLVEVQYFSERDQEGEA
jgi:hypothetical protein